MKIVFRPHPVEQAAAGPVPRGARATLREAGRHDWFLYMRTGGGVWLPTPMPSTGSTAMRAASLALAWPSASTNATLAAARAIRVSPQSAAVMSLVAHHAAAVEHAAAPPEAAVVGELSHSLRHAETEPLDGRPSLTISLASPALAGSPALAATRAMSLRSVPGCRRGTAPGPRWRSRCQWWPSRSRRPRRAGLARR
jgi:hypothetical protein